MRTISVLLAAASAFGASPALAQIGIGGGVTGGVQVDTSRTVGGAFGTVDRAVDRTDRAVNRTVDRTAERELRVATSADIRSGASVRDSRGRHVGAIARLDGGTAIVIDNNRTYQVPLGALYRRGRGLVTNLSRAELEASGAASGSVARSNRSQDRSAESPSASHGPTNTASGRGDVPY